MDYGGTAQLGPRLFFKTLKVMCLKKRCFQLYADNMVYIYMNIYNNCTAKVEILQVTG